MQIVTQPLTMLNYANTTVMHLPGLDRPALMMPHLPGQGHRWPRSCRWVLPDRIQGTGQGATTTKSPPERGLWSKRGNPAS